MNSYFRFDMHLKAPPFRLFVGLAILAATAVALSGCNPPKTAKNSPDTSSSKSVSPRDVPTGFEKIQDNLLVASLDQNNVTSDKLLSIVEDSNITFANQFETDVPEKFLETGSGVALGDFDNDGLVDVYLLGASVPNALYRNLGGFKFEDVTESAGVNGSVDGKDPLASGATFVDIDNDGDLDLFVCNMDAPNLMYVNDGNGSFHDEATKRGLTYTGASKVGSFCDFDQDGDLDLYLLTYRSHIPPRKARLINAGGKPQIAKEDREHFFLVDGVPHFAGERDILYRNRGNGTFDDVTKRSGLEAFDLGLGCAWFDHDRDGLPDLYVSNDLKTPNHLWHNNGDGTFTDIAADCFVHTPWFSMGFDSGDLNNDGWDDLLVADMAPTTHYQQKIAMGAMSGPGSAADFLTYGQPKQYMKNVLHVNSGAGKYLEAASMTGMSSTDWTWAVRFVDLDNDGWQDVLVTNGHASDSMNSDDQITLEKMKAGGATQQEINEYQLNIRKLKEKNLAFRNLGGLRFQSINEQWGFDHKGVSHGLAAGDLDNDGDLDLIVNNYFENALVYQNNSQNESTMLVEIRCEGKNRFGVGATVETWQGDFYQSKSLYPTRGYLSSDEPVVHFGFPSTESVSKMRILMQGSTWEFDQLELGKRYRVLLPKTASHSSTDKLKIEPMFAQKTVEGLEFRHQENEFDDYAREPLLPYQLSKLGGSLATCDLNGDQKSDVFCGGATNQMGSLFVSAGDSYQLVEGPWEQDAKSEDMGALFFDADNDGDLDLYVVSGSTECEAGDKILLDRLYLNLSTKDSIKFEKSVDSLPDNRFNGSGICAADFDRDGDLDLFVGSRSVPGKYPLVPKSQLLINDGGKFQNAPDSVTNGLTEVGLVNSAIWSDFDGDGWLDLFVALDWGPVTVFKNIDGVLENDTERVGLSGKLGWWRGIVSADLDQDGDLDYVVSNQGQNTKYHADKKHPHRLYFHDFDSSGTLDLVETKFEGDRELPIRGRSCSSHAMPFIKDKFKTYESFALADLTDIYEPEICDRNAMEVNWLDASVLWNRDGAFEIEALPHLAQISPSFGMDIADFDGDGIDDLFLANNFYPNQIETGFMDGGLSWLLKGNLQDDGSFTFDVVWPNQSGVVLQNDSNAVAGTDIDLDGDRDILVVENDGSLVVLENRSQDISWTSIKLDASHCEQVGTQVILTGPKTKRAFPISAGGSYLSQSDAGHAISIPTGELKKFDKATVVWGDGSRTEQPLAADEPSEIVFTKQ